MKVFFVRHGQTQANVELRSYKEYTEPITELGRIQATLAGKYLKTFGEFDLVISSPATRCIQTAENICKEINYTKSIITKESNNISPKLILEKIYEKYAGMSNKDGDKMTKDILNKNDKLQNLMKHKDESNQFKRIDLLNDVYKILCKIKEIDTPNKIRNNHIKFLNQLKKLNKKCILVVCHGGTVRDMTNIITNTFHDPKPNISIIPIEYKDSGNSYELHLHNTSIMGCYIKNNKITLVIPPNTLHLKDLNKD
jgi:broad specificity phosphatase PhoE